MIEENNDIINNEEEDLLTQEEESNTTKEIEDPEKFVDEYAVKNFGVTQEQLSNAKSYTENTNAIKMVRDFYANATEETPTDIEIEGIISNYNGDHESMIRDLYKNYNTKGVIRKGYEPTNEDIESTLGYFGLKKKDTSELDGSTSGSEDGISDFSGPISDWTYDPVTSVFNKNGRAQNIESVPENIKNELIINSNEEFIDMSLGLNKLPKNVKEHLNLYRNEYLESPEGTWLELMEKEGGEDILNSLSQFADKNTPEGTYSIPSFGSFRQKVLNPHQLVSKSGYELYLEYTDLQKSYKSLPGETIGKLQERRSKIDKRVEFLKKAIEEDSRVTSQNVVEHRLKPYKMNDNIMTQAMIAPYNVGPLKNVYNSINETEARTIQNNLLENYMHENFSLEADLERAMFARINNSSINPNSSPEDIKRQVSSVAERIYDNLDRDIVIAVENFHDPNGKKGMVEYLNLQKKKDKIFEEMKNMNSRIIELENKLGTEGELKENEQKEIESLRDTRERLNNELKNIETNRSQLKENRGFGGNELYDMSGRLIDTKIENNDVVQDASMWQDQKNQRLAQYTDILKDGNATDYQKIKDEQYKLYYKKKALEDIYMKKIIELPSGQKMTLEQIAEVYMGNPDDSSVSKVKLEDYLMDGGRGEFLGAGYGQEFRDEYQSALKDLVEENDPTLNVGISMIRNLHPDKLQTLRKFQNIAPALSVNPLVAGSLAGFDVTKNLIKQLQNPEDMAFISNTIMNFRDNYYSTLTSLEAVTEALTWNVDPGLIGSERSWGGNFLSNFSESLGENLMSWGVTDLIAGTKTKPEMGGIATENDLINNYYQAYLQSGEKMPFTQKQLESGKLDMSDVAGMGVGASIPIMLELVATRGMAAGGLKMLKLKSPRFMAMRNYLSTTKGGKVMTGMLEDMAIGAVSFQMTTGDAINWKHGVGEGFVEGIYKRIFRAGPAMQKMAKLYKQYGNVVPVGMIGTRVAAGANAQFIAEYSGEFLNNLDEVGFNWQEAMNRTFGATRDERVRNLGATAIVSMLFSGAFSIPTAYSMKAELDNMVSGTSDLVSEANGGPLSEEAKKEVEHIKSAIAEYINSPAGQQLSLWNNMTLDEVMQENPEAYSFMENIILQADATQEIEEKVPNYRVNGKDISKDEMIKHMLNADFISQVKGGSIDVAIHDDQELENELAKNFTKDKYAEYVVAKTEGPGKKGGKYTKHDETEDLLDFRKYEYVIKKQNEGGQLNSFDIAIKEDFENNPGSRDKALRFSEQLAAENQSRMEDAEVSQEKMRDVWMPPSRGRQLNLFDNEGVRNVGDVVSQVPAGSRLFNNPNPETSGVASNYIANNRKKLNLQESEPIPVTDINVENSKSIADAFDKMKHLPEDPEVKAAYQAMVKETIDQFKEVSNSGYKVEIYEGDGEPYANSDEMIKDVRDNKHMYIFSTDVGDSSGGFGERESWVGWAENPLLAPTEIVDIKGKPLLVNDIFRFVHDFFGHTELGNGFGPIGEENAWLNHSRMYSDQARRAMTTETRGQNSWVNFNKGLRNPDGSIPSKGDPNYVRPQDRPYAEQKIGLLPNEFVFQKPAIESLDTPQDLLNLPFKYNRTDKVYKGSINGTPIEMKREPGEGIFIDKADNQPLGVNKAQAIKALKEKYGGIRKIYQQSDAPDNTTTEIENTKELLDVAMGGSDGTVGDVNVEAPVDSESLSDRMSRKVDDGLDNISRYGNRLNESVTMGLDLPTYKGFLNTFKDGLKSGRNISTSLNNALKAINTTPEIETKIKGRYLYANDGVMREARKLVRQGIKPKEFTKSINKKYKGSFKKDQIKEMYAIATKQVNPTVVKSDYKTSQNNSIESAYEKIQSMVEEGVAPLEISFNKNGYVNFDGEGNVKFKQYGWRFDKSPKLEGLKYEDKVEIASEMLMDDFNNFKDLKEVQEAVEWYPEARKKIEEMFGSNSDLFIKLLSVTSPNRTVKSNFQDATEAMHMYSIGEYDKLLDIYSDKVNKINDRMQCGEITKEEAVSQIKKASYDPENRVSKANGKSFGMSSTDGPILRVLYGNWIGLNPGSKTVQFAGNLSGRNKNATIDIWAARNLRKILYSGTNMPWRMREIQETGVGKKDFDFAQAVYSQAAENLGITPFQLQAVMWIGEKRFWSDNGWTSKAGEPSYMSEQIPDRETIDRIMIGASSYIGKDASPETIERIRMTGARVMEQAREQGLDEEAIYIVGREAMNGEVRLTQAIEDIFEETKKLDPIAGRPTLGDGVYMGAAEPTIESEITIERDADISGLVDRTLKVGHYSERQSVYVSKLVDGRHPNARPFFRVEFTNPGIISEQFLLDEVSKTIEGATVTKNQRGETTGFYAQFIPEYAGTTIESFLDDSKNYENKFATLVDNITNEYGPKSIHQVDRNYVNTKVFNYAEYTKPNGEYREINESDRRFDTSLEKELQRAADIDGRNTTKNIIDKPSGNENTSGSIWKNKVTDRFAAKLDQLERDLDELMFSDPLLIVPTIKAGIKVGKAVLRATNNVLAAIDAVNQYVKDNKPKDSVFTEKEEQNIKDYFYEFASVDNEGMTVDGETNSSGEKVLSKEELNEQQENEETAKIIDDTPLFRESGNIVYTDPDVVQAVYENMSIQEKSKNSPIRGNQFERIKHLLNEGNVLYMEEMVDVKFRVKDAISRIARKMPELDEASTYAIMEIINWGQSSGEAKNISDKVDIDLWKGGRMDRKDIDKVGFVNTLKRIIQLDKDYDEKKLMIDNLIDQLNSIEAQTILSKEDLKAMKKPKSKYAESPEYQGKKAEIEQLVSSRDLFLNELNQLYNFKIDGARMTLKQVGGVWGLYNKNGEEISKGLAGDKQEAYWRLHHTRYHPGAGVIDPATGKPTPADLEIPGIDKDLQLNKEISEEILKGMKTEGSPQYMDNFSEINDISERYAEENRKILDMLLDEGLLTEEVHAELRPKFYTKRAFSDKILTRENNVVSRRDRKTGRQEADHLDDFLKGLKAGDDGVMYMNPVRLLRQSIAASSYLKFENRARKALYDFIIDGTQEEMRARDVAEEIGADQNDIPNIREIVGYIAREGEGLDNSKYVEMSYMEQGERVNFVVNQDIYNSFFGAKKIDMGSGVASLFQMTTMPVNRVLRRFATGNLNPAFWIANVNLDFQNLTLFTEAYTQKGYKDFIPGVTQVQATKDFAGAVKAAMNKSEEYQKAVSQGMSLEWLSNYGSGRDLETIKANERIAESLGRIGLPKTAEYFGRDEFATDKKFFSKEGFTSFSTFLEAINFLNQSSEIAGRLTARRKWIKNYTDDYIKKWGKEPEGWDLEKIERMATGQAVKNANFNQAGRTGKFIDQSIMPYFNPFMQIWSRGVDYVKNNPKEFGKTALKAGAICASLAAYNMTRFRVKDEEKEKELKERLTEAQKNEDKDLIMQLKKQIDNNRIYHYDYLTDYERDNFMNIIFPEMFDDDSGKPFILKVPLDARLNALRIPFEESVYYQTRGIKPRYETDDPMAYLPWGEGSEKTRWGRALKKALPLEGWDPTSLTQVGPLGNAYQKIKNNYDPFRQQKVWRGPQKIEGYNQYWKHYSIEDKFLKDLSRKFANEDELGRLTGGFNVEQWKEGIGSIITNPDRNIWYQMFNTMYVAGDAVIQGNPEIGKNLMEGLSNTFEGPFKRFHMRLDSNEPWRGPKSKFDIQAEEAMKIEANDIASFKLAKQEAFNEMGVELDSDGNLAWKKGNDEGMEPGTKLTASEISEVQEDFVDAVYEIKSLRSPSDYSEWSPYMREADKDKVRQYFQKGILDMQTPERVKDMLWRAKYYPISTAESFFSETWELYNTNREEYNEFHKEARESGLLDVKKFRERYQYLLYINNNVSNISEQDEKLLEMLKE